MPPPPQLPKDIVHHFDRKKKPRNRRMTIALVMIGVVVLGLMAALAYFALPLFHYFLPSTSADAGMNGSTEMPSLSFGELIGSAGMPDASKELEVISSEVKQSGPSSWVEGKIYNAGTTTYDGASITYDLYDAKGQFVGSSYTLLGEIAPGQTISFTTQGIPKVATKAKLKYIMGGSLDNMGKK